MNTHAALPRQLPPSRVRTLVRRGLERATGGESLDVVALEVPRSSLVRSLPSWVARYGVLAGGGEYWLYCEPGDVSAETFPSQMVLEVPPGRYMIEVLDPATSTWVSRESAEGGTLVAGLTPTGRAVLVRIRAATAGPGAQA